MGPHLPPLGLALHCVSAGRTAYLFHQTGHGRRGPRHTGPPGQLVETSAPSACHGPITLVAEEPRTTRRCAAAHDTLATAAAHNFNARRHTRCGMGLARPAPAILQSRAVGSIGSIVFDPTTALHVSKPNGRDSDGDWTTGRRDLLPRHLPNLWARELPARRLVG